MQSSAANAEEANQFAVISCRLVSEQKRRDWKKTAGETLVGLLFWAVLIGCLYWSHDNTGACMATSTNYDRCIEDVRSLPRNGQQPAEFNKCILTYNEWIDKYKCAPGYIFSTRWPFVRPKMAPHLPLLDTSAAQ